MTTDGVELFARSFVARLNAYRFGRPITAMNLLTAFLPPDFFDGTHGLTSETSLNVFGAVAILNLMMDQVHNVEANVDVDGTGPLAAQDTLIDAHIFIAPIGDPFVLLMDGFRSQSTIVEETEATTDGADDSATSTDATDSSTTTTKSAS